MFGSKESTDKYYKNERTFECYNICSCSTRAGVRFITGQAKLNPLFSTIQLNTWVADNFITANLLFWQL